MAEVIRRLVSLRRHTNRRQALERVLRDEARTPQEVLAAAAAYFRAVFHRVDAPTARRLAGQLIELTDREAGENR